MTVAEQMNNDCISRQAVLDTIDSYIAHHMGFLDLKLYITELSSVQPEPFVNKPCVSEQACHEDKLKVLEKIKAEIESQRKEVSNKNSVYDELQNYYYGLNDGLKDARDILDKYMAESEDKEWN